MQGIFATDSVVYNPVIQKIAKEILVEDYTHYQGVVLSTAGSEAQYWHRDCNTLQNRSTDGRQLVTLDDFQFTVLFPCLVDVTLENGPTEFYAGSHKQASYEYDENSRCYAECPLGSALFFNGKLNHRGGANPSNEDRPVIYQVYHKLWYNDNFRKGVDESASPSYSDSNLVDKILEKL